MSSGTRLRSAGTRKEAPMKSRPSLLSNSLGVHTSDLGEKRLNLEQIYALEHLFQSSTPVQAARTVLSGQLLSGGISLRKEGEDVELTPEFKQHLHEVWIPFAQDIIDSMLKWGICCVSYEEQVEDSRRSVLMAKRRKAAQPPPILRGKGSRAAKAAAAAAADAAAAAVPPVVVPVVPLLGTYEIAYVHGGRQGYTREYLVYSNAPGQGTREDEEARVFVKQHPDSAGNVNSPLASVFELGSFVGALTELAITAESCRARPRMVTQMRKKDTAQLDPGNLFFDSESRAVQAGADHDDNAHQARALQFQQSMCDMINRLQTRQPKHDHDLHSFGGQGRLHNAGKAPYAPPEVPPSLFTVPKDQELAPNIHQPESRGDLEALSRLAIEQFSCAFGIPADLIFSGRFAGKSTSQLSLLNITVSQMAKAVNSVLTQCYRDIYASGPEDDVGQLQLLTSPLAATEEVAKLFEVGLVPVDLAMPAVLHAIGAAKDDIDRAVEKAKEVAKEKEECERCQKDDEHNERVMAVKEREAGIKKTEADIKKVEHDARAPYPSAAGSSGGGDK